ncbi:serine/threonine-protein kinase [Ruminococcus sp.]|uniref:serine/threonine-protein kinase n=1 Tax=Ruminococcus sp. TaxID=41978 RepID=UPI0039674FD4
MPRYDELKSVRRLSERGDTNSVVDLVRDENTGDFYVRKIIFGVEQPLYQGIFSREVQALYKLNICDNIVKILGHNNLVYVNKTSNNKEKVGCIILEYISGEALSKTNISKLTSKQKFKIIKQLLSAIETAHYNGIIHRDINPNNIMLDDNGDVKVIDFGICKIKQMVNSATVFRMGTNSYSAPEVHLHSQNATEQSDLYSIGAVIFYLFTGEQPPLATCFQDTINQASGFDVNLKPIVKKLVAENPNERYKDVSELKGDLAELLERFLDVNYTAVLTIAHEKFVKLKNLNLIPKNSMISDLKTILPANFLEIYINQVDDKYQFLGTNYYFECIYNAQTNIFAVTDIKKIVPVEREIMKKSFARYLQGLILLIQNSFIGYPEMII